MKHVVWNPLGDDGDIDIGEIMRPIAEPEPTLFIAPDLLRSDAVFFGEISTLFTVIAANDRHRFLLGIRRDKLDSLIAFIEWARECPLDLRPVPHPSGVWPPPNVCVGPRLRAVP